MQWVLISHDLSHAWSVSPMVSSVDQQKRLYRLYSAYQSNFADLLSSRLETVTGHQGSEGKIGSSSTSLALLLLVLLSSLDRLLRTPLSRLSSSRCLGPKGCDPGAGCSRILPKRGQGSGDRVVMSEVGIGMRKVRAPRRTHCWRNFQCGQP